MMMMLNKMFRGPNYWFVVLYLVGIVHHYDYSTGIPGVMAVTTSSNTSATASVPSINTTTTGSNTTTTQAPGSSSDDTTGNVTTSVDNTTTATTLDDTIVSNSTDNSTFSDNATVMNTTATPSDSVPADDSNATTTSSNGTPSTTTTTTTTPGSSSSTTPSPYRTCGSFIGIVTKEEIKQLGWIHLEPYYQDVTTAMTSSDSMERLQNSWNVVYDIAAKFDVALYKTCCSCEQIDLTYYHNAQTLLPGYHTSTYCNQTAAPYYKSIQSAITFVPILKDGVTDPQEIVQALPPQKNIRAFLSLRPTHENYDTAPTVFFPSDVSDFIHSNYGTTTATGPSKPSNTSTVSSPPNITNDTVTAVSKDGIANHTISNSNTTRRVLRNNRVRNEQHHRARKLVDDGTDGLLKGGTATPILRRLIVEYIPVLLASSSGSIGILPDYLGYGESATTANRTVLEKGPYESAGVVSYFGTKYWLEKALGTSSCGSIDMTAITIQGLEDGAFAAPFVSMALQRFKIRSTTVFIAAGPLDLELFWSDIVTKLNTTTGSSTNVSAIASDSLVVPTTGIDNVNISYPRLQELFYQSLFSYGTDGLISSSFRSVLDQRYVYPGKTEEEPVSKIGYDAGVSVSDMYNKGIAQLLIDGPDDVVNCPLLVDNPDIELSGDDPTYTSFLRGVCTIVRDNSAWNAMMNVKSQMDPATNKWQRTKWIYPINVCYSETDPLFSPDHYLDVNATDNNNLQSMYTRYTGPDPTAIELQVSSGASHERSYELCILAPMLFLSYQGFVPENEIDRPNYFSDLSPEELQYCQQNNPNATYLLNMPLNDTNLLYNTTIDDNDVTDGTGSSSTDGSATNSSDASTDDSSNSTTSNDDSSSHDTTNSTTNDTNSTSDSNTNNSTTPSSSDNSTNTDENTPASPTTSNDKTKQEDSSASVMLYNGFATSIIMMISSVYFLIGMNL